MARTRTSYLPAPKVDEPKVAFVLYEGGRDRRRGAGRRRLKRVTVPASADKVRVDGPGAFRTDEGKSTYGMQVSYRQRQKVTASAEGRYPRRLDEMTRRRVVSLAKPAGRLRLLDVAAQSRAGEVERELLRTTGARPE